jgi:hypothetical protein
VRKNKEMHLAIIKSFRAIKDKAVVKEVKEEESNVLIIMDDECHVHIEDIAAHEMFGLKVLLYNKEGKIEDSNAGVVDEISIGMSYQFTRKIGDLQRAIEIIYNVYLRPMVYQAGDNVRSW